MCQWCIPINKNKERSHPDSTEGRKKDTVSEEHKQILNKT